jgi:hypothetical protein
MAAMPFSADQVRYASAHAIGKSGGKPVKSQNSEIKFIKFDGWILV